MNRRYLLTGIAATAAVVVLPKGVGSAPPKESWAEYGSYTASTEPQIKTLWLHMYTLDNDEQAAGEFKRLAAREPNAIEAMEIAQSEFLITSDEARERNEIPDESACFTTDYENLKIYVMFVRRGEIVVRSAFEVIGDRPFEQVRKIHEALFKHQRLPSKLTMLDITGSQWAISHEGSVGGGED